jgi:hypothetical protein
VIPGRITLDAVLLRTATFTITGRWGWVLALREILRTVTVPGFIFNKFFTAQAYFFNIQNEQGIKMKNKPYPALVRTS